jgi:hypothetical protein
MTKIVKVYPKYGSVSLLKVVLCKKYRTKSFVSVYRGMGGYTLQAIAVRDSTARATRNIVLSSKCFAST